MMIVAVMMAMDQRSHSKEMLGDRGASVNRYLLSLGWGRAAHCS